MARFYIDLHDGANFVRDDTGFDLPSEAVALAKLASIMGKVARDLPAALGRQDYLAIVRDDAKRVIFRAHLSFDVERV